MTCKIHIRYHNYFTFIGNILWTSVSIFIMAFNNLPWEQSLMQVVKIIYFMVNSQISFFSQHFPFLWEHRPCSLHSPCILIEVPYEVLSYERSSNINLILCVWDSPMPIHTFPRRQSNASEFKWWSWEREIR